MNHITKHLFVINPKSFLKKSKQNYVVTRIHQFFREIDNSNYDIYVSRFPRDAVGYIPKAAKDLPEETTLRVYAVGGDGILFDCLNGIMGLPKAELAAMPYGYTNNFLQGFNNNEKMAFRLMSRQYNAPTVPMDVMRCGNIYALNSCSIGMEAEAIRRAGKTRGLLEGGHAFSQWLSKRLYGLFFFAGGLGASSNKKLLSQFYEVEIGEEKFAGAYQGFSIFNGPYIGKNLHPVNSAMPNDGILDMIAIRGQGVLKTFMIFPFYQKGHYKMFPHVFSLKQGKKINIHSKDILYISMDGSAFFESDIEIELLPAAIQFVDASKHGYKGRRL